jgi:tetratricopeptide (TPR) repeat protein
MSSLHRLLISGTLLAFSGFCVLGQDLGSSNKLFGGTKKTTPATKAPVKRKPAAEKSKSTATAKAKTAPKKIAPVAKTTKSTTKTPTENASASKTIKTPAKTTTPPATDKTRFSEFKTTESKTIAIPTAKKVDPPVTAAASNLFEDLIEEGNVARDERKYAAAEAAYNRAKPLKPKDARAVYGLGNLYSDQQRWEQSEAEYRKALTIDPSSAIAHVALSYVLTQPVAAPNLSERYEEAEKLARRAIQMAPSNSLAFDQMGVALELRGEIGTETEHAYRRSIQLDSSFAPAHAHLARLLQRRGRSKESEASYKDAVKRSTEVATMVLVADVMQSEQRFKESEKLLQRAVNDDPRNPSALFLLGRALTALGKFSDAERVLRTSLDVSPNAVMANSLLGTLYSRQNKFELAENALLQAVRSASKFEKRLLSQQFEAVGDGYMKQSKRPPAERAYRQAIELDAERASLAGKLSKARFG